MSLLLVLVAFLLLLLAAFFERNDQLVVGVYVHLEVLLRRARNSQFHTEVLLVLDDVDRRHRSVFVLHTHPLVAEKVVEQTRQPILISHYRHHNFVLLRFIWLYIVFVVSCPELRPAVPYAGVRSSRPGFDMLRSKPRATACERKFCQFMTRNGSVSCSFVLSLTD